MRWSNLAINTSVHIVVQNDFLMMLINFHQAVTQTVATVFAAVLRNKTALQCCPLGYC
jgi:hypothetical protein